MTDFDPTQPVDLDELDRYRAEASDGQWLPDIDPPRRWVHTKSRAGTYRLVGFLDDPDDAAYVCELVNAWPRLRDELRAHRAREART